MAFPSEIVSILEPRMASFSAVERIIPAMAYFDLGRVQDGTQQWEKGISADPELASATLMLERCATFETEWVTTWRILRTKT